MGRSNKNNDIPPEIKERIAGHLKAKQVNFKLPYGTVNAVATEYDCSAKAVSRIWAVVKHAIANCVEIPPFVSNRPGRCGRKKRWVDVKAALPTVPFHKRTNLRSTAKALGIGKTTVHRALKHGNIQRTTNAVKPHLTETHMAKRLEYCLSMVDESDDYKIDAMENRVFIDEKWFELTRATQGYYVVEGETPPHRTVQSKRYIPKVMFIAAVMRPIYNAEGKEMFSGKVGVWPFVEVVLAKRNSCNRLAGTPETKSVTVDRERHRKMLVEHVIPAIKASVPPEMKSVPLIIQQDGAKAHVLVNDPVVAAECSKDGWTIRMENQPAQSPDLNILDLGFFAAIQSLQHETTARSIDELIAATEKAFDSMESTKLDNNFLSLHQVIQDVIRVKGGNTYTLAHMGKDALRRRGELPRQLSCDEALYLEGSAYHFLSNLEEYIEP